MQNNSLNKKIFIFGANGMLGNYIVKYFELNVCINIIKFTKNNYDITKLSKKSLEKLLVEHKIDFDTVIINCAGIIPQANNYILNNNNYYLINSIFPIMLSHLSNKYHAKLIHISTDCVFSGKKGNYVESDHCDVSHIYGLSKSFGEIHNSTIIRTSIIGDELYNKRSLVEWIKSNNNNTINGFKNHLWNGVTCLQLAKIIHKIILDNNYWIGVRHVFSDIITKYDLVNMICDTYNLNIDVIEFFTAESYNRTLNSLYNMEGITKNPPLKEQIKDMFLFQQFLY